VVFKQGSNGLRSKLAVSVIILFILVICLVLSLRGSVENNIPVSNMKAAELFDHFTKDPASAYNNLLNEIIVVEGKVHSISGKTICLGFGMRIVRLEFQKRTFQNLPPVKIGETLVVKGICHGLDYTEVVIGQSILLAQMD